MAAARRTWGSSGAAAAQSSSAAAGKTLLRILRNVRLAAHVGGREPAVQGGIPRARDAGERRIYGEPDAPEAAVSAGSGSSAGRTARAADGRDLAAAGDDQSRR